MRILISGATGLLGQAIATQRRTLGDNIVSLSRTAAENTIPWNPLDSTPLDPAAVSNFDAVIHLAGEPVAGRWTAEKKRLILESRALGTRKLTTALAAAPAPPKIFLCASGINVYGDHGPDLIDESTPAGQGFLANVCRVWEAACDPLQNIARIVNMRIGVVLAAQGGTLATMLPIFRLGLGGPVAGGKPYVSWITLLDLVRAVDFLLATPELSGPVNLISPNPVTSLVFTRALAQAVHRPAFFPVPAFAARLAFGEMVDETILSSVRALPTRLTQSGFHFDHPEIAQALTASGIHP